MKERLESAEAAASALARVRTLMDTEGPQAAVDFSDAVVGESNWVTQVRALAASEAGERLRDRDLITRGVKLWRHLGPDRDSGVAYNLAVTEQALWDLAVAQDVVKALEHERGHLHEARALYARVGADGDTPADFRAKALTNLGNSFDHCGRDVDALDAYDEALSIQRRFAMALGNRGITLLGAAPYAGEHLATVAHEAAVDLDAALADPEGVVEHGGPDALESMRRHRTRLQGPDQADLHELPASQRFDDPHWEWCRRNGLFLHPSVRCIHNDTDPLDPLFFRGLTVGINEEEQARMCTLLDAFGTLKQDFAAARYTAWLTEDDASPIREHAAIVSGRIKFLDSLGYVRWGVRTGMAAQAFTAALNLLDKISVFVQLYFRTGRVRLYFRDLWHGRTPKNKPDQMVVELAGELRRGNRGLLALCDLSCDLEQDTPIAQLVEVRNAATHRFLVAHDMLLDGRTPSSEWLQRLPHREVLDATLELLGIARAALIYLARTVDIAERPARDRGHSGPSDGSDAGGAGDGVAASFVPKLNIPRATTEHLEF